MSKISQNKIVFYKILSIFVHICYVSELNVRALALSLTALALKFSVLGALALKIWSCARARDYSLCAATTFVL
jgi:hypothetical protein